MILRYFFSTNYNVVESAGAGGITYALINHEYLVALIIGAATVVLSVVGTIALERRDFPQ